MVKPLTFKGDKRPKKRKHREREADDEGRPAKAPATEGNAEVDDDDSWVTAEAAADLAGPVIIVLPSEPPSCLACDVAGKVFPLEIENIVEGDLSTAEPHDVRQVWIATQIVGTGSVSLKGHHGKYVNLMFNLDGYWSIRSLLSS